MNLSGIEWNSDGSTSGTNVFERSGCWKIQSVAQFTDELPGV